MKQCKTVKLYFANGETRETLISKKITDEEIKRMGINEYFNLGTEDKEDNQLCVKVEID